MGGFQRGEAFDHRLRGLVDKAGIRGKFGYFHIEIGEGGAQGEAVDPAHVGFELGAARADLAEGAAVEGAAVDDGLGHVLTADVEGRERDQRSVV